MSKQSGMGGRELKTAPSEAQARFKADSPTRLLPELVYELLALAEEALPPGPDPRRVRLRNHMGRMRAVFPRQFQVTVSDAHWDALEEGEDMEGIDG